MNSFREKLLTLQISPRVRQPSARKNYHDQEALDKTFGPDAKERLMEDTDGYGYARTIGERVYHRNRRTGDVESVAPDDFLTGPESEDVV